jgi:hypothetical protein
VLLHYAATQQSSIAPRPPPERDSGGSGYTRCWRFLTGVNVASTTGLEYSACEAGSPRILVPGKPHPNCNFHLETAMSSNGATPLYPCPPAPGERPLACLPAAVAIKAG